MNLIFKSIILVVSIISVPSFGKPIELKTRGPVKSIVNKSLIDSQLLDTTAPLLQLQAGQSHLIKFRLGSQYHDLFNYMTKISISVSADLLTNPRGSSLQIVSEKILTSQDVIFGKFKEEPQGWYVDLEVKVDIPMHFGGMYQLMMSTYALEVADGLSQPIYSSIGEKSYILIDNPQPGLIDTIGPSVSNVSFEKKAIIVGEPIVVLFKAKDASPICHDGMPLRCMPDRHIELNLIDPQMAGPSINAAHSIEYLGDDNFRIVIMSEAYGQRTGVFYLQDFYLFDDKGNLSKWSTYFPNAPRISIKNQIAG